MKRNTLLTLCAISALGATTAIGIVKAAPVEPASATTLACDTRTWNSTSSTDFSLDANWDPTNAPDTANEKAVIPDLSGDLVPPGMTANETVGSLEIQSGGSLGTNGYALTITASGDCDGILTIANGTTLDIEAGGKVILASAVTHDIDGQLKLSTSTSTLAITNSPTVDGDGNIIGEDNSAELQISAGKTLTNNITVSGKMKVMTATGGGGVGNGVLLNGATGIVRADADGGGSDAILLLASGLTIDDADTGTPKWEAATDADAVLQFDQAATGLDGDFTLSDNATLKFLANITTSGSFTANPRCGDLVFVPNDGTICFVANGNSFSRCTNQTYSTGCP